MKPICVPCQRFFRPKRNGFHFLEGMSTSMEAKPGKAERRKWKPYKLWVGDLWECRDCKAQIVVGVPLVEISEHYKDDFLEEVHRRNATQLQVNDC